MKKISLLAIVMFLGTLCSFAQNVNDVFNYKSEDQFVWLGVDFSHMKMIGDFAQFESAGEKTPEQIRDDYFPGWNMLLLNEAEKYDFKSIFRRKSMFISVEEIMEKNSLADVSEMFSYNAPNYTKENIQKFVNELKLEGKEGVGVLLVAECLNKVKAEGVFHVVAVNMKTKEVLFSERLTGAARGFGLKNYWAGSMYKVISIAKGQFPKWRKQHIVD